MVFVFCLDWRGETRMCNEKYLMTKMQPVWFLFAAIPGHHASQDGREALERHEENADTEVQIKILILNFILFHLLFIIDVFYPPRIWPWPRFGSHHYPFMSYLLSPGRIVLSLSSTSLGWITNQSRKCVERGQAGLLSWWETASTQSGALSWDTLQGSGSCI